MDSIEAKKQVSAMAAVLDLIVDTVKESGPLGAPAGHLYAALNSHLGWELSTFEKVMGALCQAGRLRKQGHVYHVGKAGK